MEIYVERRDYIDLVNHVFITVILYLWGHTSFCLWFIVKGGGKIIAVGFDYYIKARDFIVNDEFVSKV